MKTTLAAVFAAAAFVCGSPLPRDAPGVLSLPLSRVSAVNSTLARRGDVDEPFTNYRSWLYTGVVGFGTPAQSFQEVIDTGSSDLWTYAGSTKAGGFDSTKSGTYKLLKKGGFSITYVLGDASGDLVSETVTISGAKIPNQQLGIVTKASQPSEWGTIGVGFASNEATTWSGGQQYANVPVSLKATGAIQRNLYSLYLNSLTSAGGEILFGGIDTAKYTGKLNKAPFLSTQVFSVATTIYGVKMAGILDSGTSALTIASDAWSAAIVDIQNAIPDLQYDASENIYYVNDLSQVPSGPSLPVTIAGVTYQIPYVDLFEQTQDPGNERWNLLFFNTAVKSDGRVWLGDAFLRAVYVVFDLDGGYAGLAPAKYTADSNIVPIGSSGIPASLLA